MSRQVRTQMPQTQKKDKKSKSKGKKFDKNACLLMFKCFKIQAGYFKKACIGENPA